MSDKATHLLTDRAKPLHCLAAYLYTAEPWETFLAGAVLPFVKKVRESGLAERYFFIRYWENGPHIRLRFLGDENLLEEKIRPELIRHFGDYFIVHPTARNDEAWAIDVNYPLQKNDTVIFTRYEPETERYGGTYAITIAEKHFEDSSEAVLSAISGSEDWNYDRALGTAIQLHLGFAYAAGMNHEEAMEFYDFIFLGWFPRAYMYIPGEDHEAILQKKQRTLEAFAKNFDSQKDVLVDYHQMIWQAFEDEEEFEEEWVNSWILNTKLVCKTLRELNNSGKLVIPGGFSANPALKTPAEDQLLWSVYSSYVHMTNNRLGILNRDEGYLGYLIKESLKQ